MVIFSQRASAPTAIVMGPAQASPGLAVNAAAHAFEVRTAVVLLFLGGAATVAVAVLALPWLRPRSERMAFLLLVLSGVNLALHAVENGTLLSLLSLSRQHQDGTLGAAAFETIATMAASSRRWAHYTHLLVAVSWVCALFATLWRLRVVPGLLGALGVATALLQMAGVTLPAILGWPMVTALALPLAPAYVAIAGWLLARGFSSELPDPGERADPEHADRQRRLPASSASSGADSSTDYR